MIRPCNTQEEQQSQIYNKNFPSECSKSGFFLMPKQHTAQFMINTTPANGD